MIAPWSDPGDRLLAQDILGTGDAAEACVAIEAWILRHGLGPAAVEAIELSVGAGVTLRRADGERLFVKIWPPHVDARSLAAQLEVQQRLRGRGLPAPAVLAGPAPLGGSPAVAMSFTRPGERAVTLCPPRRRTMAAMLARLAAEAAPIDRASTLPRRTLPTGAIWPRPHSALFDFGATTNGAEWIDRLASDALAAIEAGGGATVVGHLDWSARNLRFAGDAIAMIYDWDSLFVERETVVVGSAAAQFAVGAAPDGSSPPDAAAFVEDHATARGRPFTAAERHGIAGAIAYAWAYAARCEHALDPAAIPAGSTRARLRAHGPFRLASA